MDICAEELSHLEVIGSRARLHLNPMRHSVDAATEVHFAGPWNDPREPQFIDASAFAKFQVLSATPARGMTPLECHGAEKACK